MDFKEIQKLMDEFNSSPMRELEIEVDGFHMHLSKNDVPFLPPHHANPEFKQNEEQIEVKETKEETEKCEYITSPMVGSIYLQPEPDKQAYVKVGSRVHKGDVVCIIEAMKMMTEIKSNVDGIVSEILVENEELVEFDQKIFKVVEG